MSDPLTKKIGDKAAKAVRQQIKDIGEEAREIPKAGIRQVSGREVSDEDQSTDEDNTQSGKQQLLTLLRGSKKKQKQTGDDSQQAQNRPPGDYLEKEIEQARRERAHKAREMQQQEERAMQMQERDDAEQGFTPPSGRKPRGMQNPMARKGKKKHELGRTAKG